MRQLKSCPFECSILNYNKFNNNCMVAEDLLACKNFDFLKTHTSGCTVDATHCTSMATGHNRFSVLAEHSLFFPCKITTTVSPREGYPELPDLSDNPLPYSIKVVFVCNLTAC
jgi:hypothetical protein